MGFTVKISVWIFLMNLTLNVYDKYCRPKKCIIPGTFNGFNVFIKTYFMLFYFIFTFLLLDSDY